MGTLVAGVASDLASGLLQFYVREEMLSQTTQNKPLMKYLIDKKEDFPGGLGQVSVPIQSAFLSDTAGFFVGYSEDDQLSFSQAQNMTRANYNWKEHHAGLIITWSELKKDGITITSGKGKQKEHSKLDLFRLTSVLKNRLSDYGESWARSVENLFWQDGSQDPKAMPGLRSIVFDNPAVGVVGGIDPAANVSWRNRSVLGIATSGDSQTLTRTLSAEFIQIHRYGGMPDKIFMGSAFRDALEIELRAKGLYTMTGFSKNADMGVGSFKFEGVDFVYDPWLDDHGYSKYAYVVDGRRLKLRPMQDELNRIIEPERPYNFMVFLRSMTLTSALQCTQRNALGVYSVA